MNVLRCVPTDFVRGWTTIGYPPLVPELRLHMASEVLPLWQASQDELDALGLPPPYWAFAWVGGQALARYLLDNPNLVTGGRVLDLGAGSGIAAIAAARAGAACVEASEIDDFACAAIALNAAQNGVSIACRAEDLTRGDSGPWDVLLAGDLCYEPAMSRKVVAWLRRQAAGGAVVLLGDPGRSYLPHSGLVRLAAYWVKTIRELEDSDLRETVVWRVLPE